METKKNEHHARRLWYDRRGDYEEVAFAYPLIICHRRLRSDHGTSIKHQTVHGLEHVKLSMDREGATSPPASITPAPLHFLSFTHLRLPKGSSCVVAAISMTDSVKLYCNRCLCCSLLEPMICK